MLIEVYPMGTRHRREPRKVVGEMPSEGRGKITTFSRQARLRLREFLLSNHVDGMDCYGVTLTLPLQSCPLEDVYCRFETAVHRLRTYFVRLYPRYGYVWRVELQRNRMPHLHLIVWCKDEFGVDCSIVLPLWYRIVSDLYDVPDLYSFLLHGCKCQRLDGRVASYRYLCDHAGKSKQAQLGWHGRQWGVVGRCNFRPFPPLVLDLPPCVYSRFQRCLRRVTSFSVKADCVFGCKHICRKTNNAVTYLSDSSALKLARFLCAQTSFCKRVPLQKKWVGMDRSARCLGSAEILTGLWIATEI